MDELPTFKASKRRKFARHRSEEKDIEIETTTPDRNVVVSNLDEQNEKHGVEAARVVKPRKHGKTRGGVLFSTSHQEMERRGEHEDESSSALMAASRPGELLKDISSRFTGSIGHTVDVDKHMCVSIVAIIESCVEVALTDIQRMAYVDSELAKRKPVSSSQTTIVNTRSGLDVGDQASTDESDDSVDDQLPQNLFTGTQETPKPTYNHSHLTEFDLSSATVPQAQANGASPSAPSKAAHRPRRPKRVRLDAKGNPLPPRPRRGPDESALARNALVEQVLNEHPFSVPSTESTATVARVAVGGAMTTASVTATATTEQVSRGNDLAADERLAEQFRREFLDSLTERSHKARPPTTGPTSQGAHAGTAAGAAGGHVAEGPKLGGGRSARAKMLQQQQAAKK